MRASSVVKCHWMGAARVLLCFCQAATSARMVLRSGIRRDKHWPLSALNCKRPAGYHGRFLMVPIEVSQWGRAGCTNGAY